MSYAEEYKVIQALVTQRANEPFDKRLAVGRTARSAHDLGPQLGEGLVEIAWKLPISVVLDESYSEAGFTGSLHEFFGLGCHQSLIGMQRSWRENDPSSLDVQENQNECVAEALRGQDPLTEDVGLPQAGCMAADELVPRAATSPGARIEPVFLEDVADRAFGYRRSFRSSPTIRV